MNREVALSNLKELDAIFRKNNIPYWLQDGTLLGYHRERNFIAHDKDTDIGLFFNDFNMDVLNQILQSGFRIKRVLGFKEDSLEITIFKNKLTTDLFFYYKRTPNPNVVYHCSFDRGRNRIDYEYEKFNIKEIEWFNHKFFVPEDELKFIITKYGNDWSIPNTNWDWAYSPLNHVRTNINIPEIESMEKFKKWSKL